ncbi:MAG: molybdopterin molybdotransferase MoeA [Cyclobacteriaceae bacterium]
MISVDQAHSIVLSHQYEPATVKVTLRQAYGKVLKDPVYADRDFPPFNRVMMDGIAIQYNCYANGINTYISEGIAAAGSPQTELQVGDQCIEVMTGAMLPVGTNTVIPYELLEKADNSFTIINNAAVKRGMHVHMQGFDVKSGTELLKYGQLLEAPELAVCASVGKSELHVASLPKVVVISTGNELVDVNENPKPYQIRKSNVLALDAELQQLGIMPELLHLPDDPDIIENEIRSAIHEYDAIILSGGVSKGKFDHIPGVLHKLNIERHFHGVKQRPGKPFWFGTAKDGTVIFAFPGNPVATYLCFQKYFKPWLFKSLGIEQKKLFARLEEDFSFKPELVYFLQVKIEIDELGCISAMPIPGEGSGDHANLLKVDGFLELSAEQADFKKGEVYSFIPFRNFLY